VPQEETGADRDMNPPIDLGFFIQLVVIGAVATVAAIFLLATGPRLLSHLILKYLRRRIIAWWALLAVTLCTTMVLVVISVMGGWLNMFEHSFQGLTGDIVVETGSLTGFPYYQEMIDGMLKQPGIEAAVPTIHTFGIVNVVNQITAGVQVMGVPIDQIGKVNRFPESLYLQYGQYEDQAKAEKDPKEKQVYLELAEKHAAHPTFALPFKPELYRQTLSSAVRNGIDPTKYPGMIVGSGVIGIHRESDGKTYGREHLFDPLWAKLTTVAVHPGESSINVNNKTESMYWVVDASHTGLWQYDNNFVYVPFDQLQRDLQMTATKAVDIDTGKDIIEPARTNDIHVRVKPGYDLEKAKEEVAQVVGRVVNAHGMAFPLQPDVLTWREKQRVWIDAISNEKLLTVILFGIISLVAIFLVFCIFYMIVMEKTKDIGIIKSVGATSAGVAGIFLGYGLAIGLVGSLLGLLCSYLIVHYINQLHAMLGHLFGIQIWNPEVYLFDKIPNTMSLRDIAVIVPIAIVSSVLGALLPALRAASMHPVDSLRWE